jgi:hypothetical protein
MDKMATFAQFSPDFMVSCPESMGKLQKIKKNVQN